MLQVLQIIVMPKDHLHLVQREPGHGHLTVTKTKTKRINPKPMMPVAVPVPVIKSLLVIKRLCFPRRNRVPVPERQRRTVRTTANKYKMQVQHQARVTKASLVRLL